MVPISTETGTTPSAMIVLDSSSRSMCADWKASTKFCHCGLAGHCRPGG